MAQNTINLDTDGSPVSVSVATVKQLAEMFATMVEAGAGDLPVFASDSRARYPLQFVEASNQAGYKDCLLIQPMPHVYAAVKDVGRHPASYFAHVNVEADRIRATCGAFA